jgi:hypothetical protein
MLSRWALKSALSGKKENQLDQRGNTFWGPIELVRKPYSVVDASSTYFFRDSQKIIASEAGSRK